MLIFIKKKNDNTIELKNLLIKFHLSFQKILIISLVNFGFKLIFGDLIIVICLFLH